MASPTLRRLGLGLILAPVAAVVLIAMAVFLIGAREGLFPWTDHVGTDWTTVHVRNETDAEVRFDFVYLGGEWPGEDGDPARYPVEPRRHRSFELPFVTGRRIAGVADGAPARAAFQMMLCLDGERLVELPVELAEGDHYRLRVDPEGRVFAARTRSTWLGPVFFQGAEESELAPVRLAGG